MVPEAGATANQPSCETAVHALALAVVLLTVTVAVAEPPAATWIVTVFGVALNGAAAVVGWPWPILLNSRISRLWAETQRLPHSCGRKTTTSPALPTSSKIKQKTIGPSRRAGGRRRAVGTGGRGPPACREAGSGM